MAGVAVEERQLREQAVASELGVEHAVQGLDEGYRLADRPGLGGACHGLARPIVVIDREVRRLDRGEGVELEGQAGVARTHQAVGHELGLVAEMAGQAELGPHHRIGGRVQTGGEVALMRASDGR